MQCIGLLGGTFDPIHKGHLHLAMAVLEKLNLDEIRLIPAYQPVHREKTIATAKQRLTMTRLACEGQANIVTDAIEYNRGGKSYMIDTLQAIKQLNTNASLYLIIGYDAFIHFTDWKEWETILKLAHLIVAKRPGHDHDNQKTNALIKDYGIDSKNIKSYHNSKICVLEIDALNISSTIIREKIKNHLDVSDILPTNVFEYIKQEGLYAN